MDYKEMDLWEFLGMLSEDKSTPNALSVIENHQDIFGSDSKEVFFHEVKKHLNITNEHLPSIDNIFDESNNFHSQYSGMISGIKRNSKIITVGYDCDLSIIEFKDGAFSIDKLEPEKGMRYLPRILSAMRQELVEMQPELKRAKVISDAKRAEDVRRHNHIKNVPKMPSDFWQAMQELANYSECFEEFRALLLPAMDDISDRNLTRLGRASECLSDATEFFGSSSDRITVFRCLPRGEEIEAGDWVSTDRSYAKSHEGNVNGASSVISKSIRASELIMGADTNELYYAPKSIWGEHNNLISVWKELTDPENVFSNNKSKKPMKYPAMITVINRALKSAGLPLEKDRDDLSSELAR